MRYEAAERGGAAVLGANPNLLIFVEGPNYSTDFRGVEKLPAHLPVAHRLVYSPHAYNNSYGDNNERYEERAGFLTRKRHPGGAWWGDVRLEWRDGKAIVAGLVPFGSPAYKAGLEQDDEVRQVDGQPIGSTTALEAIMSRHKPGDRIDLVSVDRTTAAKTATVTLAEDPHLEVVPAEKTGATLSAAEQQFRDRWLRSRG